MITITLYWWFFPLALFFGSFATALVTDNPFEQDSHTPFWVALGTFTPIGMVIGHFLG